MTDISQSLRELLLTRAAGQIDGEEFERRQAALHAELLAPEVPVTALTTEDPDAAILSSKLLWPWILGLLIIGASIGLYLWIGNSATPKSDAMVPMTNRFPPIPKAALANNGGDLQVMADRLAEKLAKDPKNGEGWLLLAQTYLELRQQQKAITAFSNAEGLVPMDANVLANWADAYVIANDRKWDQKARDLVTRALAADPKNLKALSLSGSEAFERADYKAAISSWKKVKSLALTDSMDIKLADSNIEEATTLMSGKRTTSDPKSKIKTVLQ